MQICALRPPPTAPSVSPSAQSCTALHFSRCLHHWRLELRVRWELCSALCSLLMIYTDSPVSQINSSGFSCSLLPSSLFCYVWLKTKYLFHRIISRNLFYPEYVVVTLYSFNAHSLDFTFCVNFANLAMTQLGCKRNE